LPDMPAMTIEVMVEAMPREMAMLSKCPAMLDPEIWRAHHHNHTGAGDEKVINQFSLFQAGRKINHKLNFKISPINFYINKVIKLCNMGKGFLPYG